MVAFALRGSAALWLGSVNLSRSTDALFDVASAPAGTLRHAWRLGAAALCFTVFGIGTLLVSAWLLLVVRPLPGVPDARKGVWVRNWIRRLARGFIELMQVLGLMRYRIENAERLLSPGQLLVANHPSLIDALFIIGHTPDICCIVKRELLANPFTAWLVRSADYLANDSERLVDEAARVLGDGRSLLVFPEGTRNRCDLALRFKRGAAHIAIASGVPVVPVTIDFSPRALQKGDPWHAIPRRVSRIRLIVHPPFDPVSEAAVEAGADAPVTVLARRTTRVLRDAFVEHARRFADPQSAHEPGRPGTPSA